MNVNEEVKEFLASWKNDPIKARDAFTAFYEYLHDLAETSLDFKARPGISYSLRAKRNGQTKRDLFTLVDVVDDDPDNRWLSVCFYADLVNDPDEAGDFVPQGLLGEDALCFNLDEDDPEVRAYIMERLKEAAANALKQA